jgi:hypothetical protein
VLVANQELQPQGLLRLFAKPQITEIPQMGNKKNDVEFIQSFYRVILPMLPSLLSESGQRILHNV